jgi:GWxTD domain-containing protein
MKAASIRIVVFVSVFLFSALGHLGQVTDGKAPSPDPSTRPIKAGSELRDAHKRWLTNDIPYIITKAERDAFLALRTDEERENFISHFWQSRDPNPDTEENEFREEYYERIAYANEHFTSGIPGWKTDRGRIYIRWGKPESMESRPSGGAYDRPSYEGGGSTTVYPFETWFYRHLDGVGDGIEIEFVDPTGTGEYRIARDPDEKNAFANIPGVGPKTQIGFGGTNQSYQRAQDGMFERMGMLSRMEMAPVAKGTPGWVIFDESAKLLNENPLNVDHRIDFFRLSDDKVVVGFTVQADSRDLKFEAIGGIETAKLNIFGRITAVSGKRTGTFEDAVTTTATRSDLASSKERKSIYQKFVVLSPGVYKIDLAVRDVVTGNQGVVRQGFSVPRYDDQKLSTSTMVLASKLRPTAAAETGAMFVIGGAKVVPNLSGVYKRGQVSYHIRNVLLFTTTPTAASSPPRSFLPRRKVPASCCLRHPPCPSGSTSPRVPRTTGDETRPSVPTLRNVPSSRAGCDAMTASAVFSIFPPRSAIFEASPYTPQTRLAPASPPPASAQIPRTSPRTVPAPLPASPSVLPDSTAVPVPHAQAPPPPLPCTSTIPARIAAC